MFLFLLAFPHVAAGEPSNARRLTGTVVGSIVGFGSGHMIQERMDTHGWLTIGEFGALFIAASGLVGCDDVGGALFFRAASGQERPEGEARSGCKFITIGSIAFVGLRVYEIVDLLTYRGPIDRRTRSVALVPSLGRDGAAGVQFLLSF